MEAIKQVPGFFLTEDINFVKQKKGPVGVYELKKKLLPDFDISLISPVRKYTIGQEIKMLRAMTEVIYGGDSPQAWEQLGRVNFESAKNSGLGKIFISLLGKKPMELLKTGGRVFSLFAPFITFRLQNLTEHSGTFILENDPYPKEYFLGSFKALGELLGQTPIIEVFETAPEQHVYKLRW